MSIREYASLDGLALGELVRKGEVTGLELLEEAIARVEKHNGAINAVVYKFYDQARDAARSRKAGNAPFEGVPLLLKDILGDCAGVPTRYGARYAPEIPAAEDCELVARYKRGGFIPFAKTNVPEFGLVPFTESQLYGPARNPWRLDSTPGGSSGGSAAAVAAGIVPIAHGNDGGGSIRIPAACCGLVGLKPTRGRNSMAPVAGDVMSGLVVEHVLTRTVRDSAAVLDATAGSVPGDPCVAPPPSKSYLREVSTSPGRLRIAFSSRGLFGDSVHPDCAEAVSHAAKLCASLGHIVQEDSPPADFASVSTYFFAIWAAGTAFELLAAKLMTGREPTRDLLEGLTWNLNELGTSMTAGQYLLAVNILQRFSRDFAGFFEKYDLWLTPTLGLPPLRIGTVDLMSPAASLADETIVRFTHVNPLYNLSGQPAISLPLYWSRDGLPIGVLFGARFGGEATLFQIAGQIEQAEPWAGRKPPIWD
jgi:amidase